MYVCPSWWSFRALNFVPSEFICLLDHILHLNIKLLCNPHLHQHPEGTQEYSSWILDNSELS